MARRRAIPTVLAAKTRLDELRAMRVVLARAIDDEATPARELSPLVRRLEELGEKIEDLETREAGAVKDRGDGSQADMPFKIAMV